MSSSKSISCETKWRIFLYVYGMLFTALSYFAYVIYYAVINRHGIVHMPFLRYFSKFPFPLMIINYATWILQPPYLLFCTLRMSVGGYLAFVINYIMFLKVMFYEEGPSTYRDDTYYIVAEMEKAAERKKRRRLDYLAFYIFTAIVSILNYTLGIINPDNFTMNVAISLFYPIAILAWYSPPIIGFIAFFYYTIGIFMCIAGYAGMRRYQLTGRM